MTDTNLAPRTGAPTETSQQKSYWRSLDELAKTPEFQAILAREFPEGAAEHSGLGDEVSRRKFLGVVAASVALAGLTSCRKPGREILPYNQRPEGIVPGLPQHYATVLPRRGYGLGALVRSHTGRPTKIEGNPDHPASLGGSDAWMQAEILQLYDPARSRHVVQVGSAAAHAATAEQGGHGEGGHGAQHPSFADFLGAWREIASSSRANQGKGLAVLMPPTTSPTLAALATRVRKDFPNARMHVWAPVAREAAVQSTRLAFGKSLDVQYAFDKARVIAAFDSDFLGVDQLSLAWTRGFANGRKVRDRSGSASRLYVAEATYTLTGSNADHRLRISSGEIGDAVLALAADLGVDANDQAMARALEPYRESNRGARFQRKGKDWIKALAADLLANPGASAVLVGERQPPFVQAVAHAINLKLKNVVEAGPVTFTPTPWGLVADGRDDAPLGSLADLVAAIGKGDVDALIVLGGNPVYDAPADLGFADAYAKVAHRIHCGLHFDETAAASTWHLPATHPLEEWGDLLALDGTASIVQPLVSPLYPDAKSSIELLATLLELDVAEDHAWVRETWEASSARPSDRSFEEFWKRALHDGVIPGTAAKPQSVTIRWNDLATAIGNRQRMAAPGAADLELNLRPCPSVFDGRFSNNGWLQELPNPIEKLTWDNAVLMSRATAGEFSVWNGDVVTLTVDGRTVDGPVWVQPGHADHAVTVFLGYGRRMASECEVAAKTGFDAYPLRTSDSPWFARGLTVAKTGRQYPLVVTQEHGAMEGRPLVRETSLQEFRANTGWKASDLSPLAQAAKLQGQPESALLNSLWDERDYTEGYQWAMSIDLSSCTGCGACVVACVAENNIPVVGKQQVANGREMHWVRVDRYFGGVEGHASQDGVSVDDEPEVVHQMVPCMQCENAPCESVCPVGATMHSPEGLNDMAYNRCIGTRYCSNNCPYKVRRFNWFNFHKHLQPSEKLAFNPDVTVRARGVMEKCTYCVQRITAGKFHAKQEGRRVRDGEIVTACQQACPADAIAFGDKTDPEARVAKLKQTDLHYAMLSELNLKPRTTYLAKVRNPNPELS